MQRKRREREGEEDRGGGGDREHMKEEEIGRNDVGLKLYTFLLANFEKANSRIFRCMG